MAFHFTFSMKKTSAVLLFFLIVCILSAQENKDCKAIIISDPLFTKASHNDFSIHAFRDKNLENNTKLFILKDSILMFNIITDPGEKATTLVTNGTLNTGPGGKKYYFIKLLYESMETEYNFRDREDYAAPDIFIERPLCFNIANLLFENKADYIQFYGEKEVIPCR